MNQADLYERARELAPEAHVLFADDDKATLGLYEYAATFLGWTGEFVTSAQATLDCINKSCSSPDLLCFDAVVTDINYSGQGDGPRLTGITVGREIRKKLDSLPIIYVSAYANSIIREEVRRLQADIFSKPVEIEELLFVTARAIAGYRQLKAIEFESPQAYQIPDKLEAPKVITEIMKEVTRANVSKGGI